MATKSAKKKSTTKVRTHKAAAKGGDSALSIGVIHEKCPENHKATGKYVFFYVLFAATTILFAALSVWLFVFSSEVLNKYQEIETCARNHTSCEVHVDSEKDEK